MVVVGGWKWDGPRPAAGANSDPVGQVCHDVGLHQLAEELLLPGDVVSPGL